MKYVVLARDFENDMVYEDYGCFKNKCNATKRLNKVIAENPLDYCYYLIEDVDPLGSYADMETVD